MQPTISRQRGKRLAWLSAAPLVVLSACGQGMIAAGAPTGAPTRAPTRAPTMPAVTPALPSDMPTGLAKLTESELQRADRLCSRMQERLAAGSMPSMGSPNTAGHALQTLAATDPARSWLAAMPADRFVAMCGYTTIRLQSTNPTSLPSCPRRSGPVINSYSSVHEFWVTEDGQYRQYRMPPVPITLPTCMSGPPGN